MTESTALDPNLQNRLTRFLYTGSELPKYFPGCWVSHKCFEEDKLTAINEALAIAPNCVEIVNIILKAYRDNWYTRFHTIAFALAKCLLLGSTNVKEAAYKAAVEVCVTPEELMLFNKFTRNLKTGNGRGWCKSVRQWYTSKEPMELAKELTRVRSRHGRSHRILLKKSHIKLADNDFARDAVVKYALFGLKRAKQLMADKPGTKEIFDYIQKVEDMRHCEDPVAAAALATQNQFSLDHVPGHLLTSQDVWNAVLPQCGLSDILYYIIRIHNMGFLTSDSTTTAILISLLNNQEVIRKSEVTPLEVYITLCNYKSKTRPLKFAKAKVATEKEQRRRTRQNLDPKTGVWEWTSTRRHPKELKSWGIDHLPNPAVLAALNKLMDQTWLVAPPTKKRYLITMDMRHHMFKGRHFCKNFIVPKKVKKIVTKSGAGDVDIQKKSRKHLLAECFYNNNTTPGHAAIVLALQLLKRERNVKLAVFTDNGLEVVDIERNFTSIDEAEFVFRNANLGKVQLDAPIEWATKTKQKFDVFINMVDRVTRYVELELGARKGRGDGGRFGLPPTDPAAPDHCPVRALYRYRRTNAGVHNAKLVVMSLASHRVGTTDGTHEGVLDIIGIDEFVPKVLDAFVLGQFK